MDWIISVSWSRRYVCTANQKYNLIQGKKENRETSLTVTSEASNFLLTEKYFNSNKYLTP